MYTLIKVSLVASIVMIITFVVESLGILDKRYASAIMDAVLVLQIALLIMAIIIFVMKSRKMHGIKIIRYQISNKLIKGDTNILPENLFPTNPRKPALFKIFLEIENVESPPDIGIFKMCAERILLDIEDNIININSGIVENSFIFDADVIVRPDEKINFKLKKDTTIKLFFLGEFYTP